MDYISREEALKIAWDEYDSGTWRDIPYKLESLPVADVVEVIRCKECIYWNAETKGCKRNPSVQPWWETDFCNYGEKMEG